MIHLVVYGGYQTTETVRLGIPGTIASDEPADIHDSVTARSGISYPSGTTIASTWNPQLAQEFGEAIGTEATFMNVHEWYGPSMNTHRSPFGGRCFEYLSEDPLLTGLLREEWGFHGCVVTDYAAANYQRADTGVLAGNNLWLAPMGNDKFEKPLRRAYEADSAGIANALRDSVKGICYMVLQTHAMK